MLAIKFANILLWLFYVCSIISKCQIIAFDILHEFEMIYTWYLF